MAAKVKDSGTLPVTVDSWIHELAALSSKNDEGHTAKELAAMAGLSVDHLLVRLQQVRALGWLVVGRRTIETIDGRKAQAPVYRVVKPSKGKR